MKTDPTREHDVLIDETTRVRWNYCQEEFLGGAYLLKHHLAWTSKHSKFCKLSPDDAKKAMEDIVYGL
jgi:hypothetical protein